MNTAIVNIKTDPKVKTEAQKVAKDLGFNLSTLINAYLKNLIRTKRVAFEIQEEPSDYLKKMIRKAEKQRAQGKGSPTFNTGEESIKWLEEQGI